MERLQKALARAGIASRRAAERLIREGRVTVNGRKVTRMGTQVEPERDVVEVDGKRVPRAPRTHTYLALHKPRGFVTTMSDPEGRPTVRDLLPDVRVRVYPVGRLDFHSEGLLLLTDDGDLARDLMHPRNRVPRTYLARVRGEPSEEALARLARGSIRIEGRKALPAACRVVRSGPSSWVEITVVEGRKHQVRRMLEVVGHPVQRLRRVSYGGVALGRLPSGRVRALAPAEVDRLRRAVVRGAGEGARRSTPGRA
jgi:23S rRNA pseudouridine2605 synthase/16S rRNA pseudouridine516 synthase